MIVQKNDIDKRVLSQFISNKSKLGENAMKFMLLLIAVPFLFFYFSGCHGTNVEPEKIDWTQGKFFILTNDSVVPDSIRKAYFNDAAILALRDVHKIDSTKHNLVNIPQSLINLYYDGLIRFYQADYLKERNLVVNKYNIHAFPTPELYSLIIGIDRNHEWSKEWKSGRRLTGNSEIDRIMILYKLQLVEYNNSSPRDYVILSSAGPINVLALAELFEPVEGIAYAEPNSKAGDGNDISVNIEEEYIKYTFSFGYGDCPSGCINRHYWVFRVYFDGRVSFIESYGDPV